MEVDDSDVFPFPMGEFSGSSREITEDNPGNFVEKSGSHQNHSRGFDPKVNKNSIRSRPTESTACQKDFVASIMFKVHTNIH